MKTRTLARLCRLLPVLMVFLAIVAVVPSIACAGGSWTAQASGTEQDLYSVAFTDVNHGWAVGYAGTILATADGGVHWMPQTVGANVNLSSVAFTDAAYGWAVGNERNPDTYLDTCIILATTDGGSHWTTQTVGVRGTLTSVSFSDSSHGWAVGYDDNGDSDGNTCIIVATTDGGSHWATQTAGTTGFLQSVTFVDTNHGWAAGGDYDPSSDFMTGIILATTDGGSHWTTQTAGTSDFLTTVSFSDSSHGWAGGGADGYGGSGFVLSTSDGGSHWAMRNGSLSERPDALTFTDALHGWAVGGTNIFSTTDAWAHWTREGVGPYLSSVAFADATHGWAVGGNGAIVAYSVSADSVPPITTSNAVGYYASSANIHLSATDNAGGSGVAHTYYTLNGASQVEGTTITKSTAGTYTLVYWSVDVDGNVEAKHTVKFTVIAKPSSGGTPSTPASIATLRHGKSFTVYGYIIKHTSGTSPVTLQFYRYQSGHWVLRKSTTAKVSNMLTFSKYSDSTSVPYSGKWRVRARHKVGSKYLYSGYRTFTAS